MKSFPGSSIGSKDNASGKRTAKFFVNLTLTQKGREEFVKLTKQPLYKTLYR